MSLTQRIPFEIQTFTDGKWPTRVAARAGQKSRTPYGGENVTDDSVVQLLQLRSMVLQTQILKSLLERQLEEGDDFNIGDIEEQESEISQMTHDLFEKLGIDFERPKLKDAQAEAIIPKPHSSGMSTQERQRVRLEGN